MVRKYEFETRAVQCVVCRGEVEQPVDLIAALAAAPNAVATAVRTRQGASADGWTPVEVAAHLADLEVARGFRFRQVLAEEHAAVEALDQEALAAALQASERDVDLLLETFAVNRRANLEVLELAGEKAMNRPYRHVVFGPMTLGQLVAHTTHHDLGHLRQIEAARR
jgi:hypothetical protein